MTYAVISSPDTYTIGAPLIFVVAVAAPRVAAIERIIIIGFGFVVVAPPSPPRPDIAIAAARPTDRNTEEEEEEDMSIDPMCPVSSSSSSV
jgi:hypothetical protein